MSSTYAVINQSNIVTSLVWWDGQGAWFPDPDTDGTPQTAVPDTDPPTAQIGFIYNPADGTFSDPTPPATTDSQSPGLISRILSALNPFSNSK
jgi:hypothetical protein